MLEKGIVVETTPKNRVVVMTFQGEFVDVYFSRPVFVGEEVRFCFWQKAKPRRVSAACLFLLLFLGSVGVLGWPFYVPGGSTPVYYITLDINPSVELALNRNQRVVGAEGLNPEGMILLSQVKLIGRSLKQAIGLVGRQAELAGYLQRGGQDIVITIAEVGGEGSRSVKHVLVEESQDLQPYIALESDLEQVILTALPEPYQINVRVWRVSPALRDFAREAGISPGDYIAAIYVQCPADVLASEPGEPTRAGPAVTVASVGREGDVTLFGVYIQQPRLTPQWDDISFQVYSQLQSLEPEVETQQQAVRNPLPAPPLTPRRERDLVQPAMLEGE